MSMMPVIDASLCCVRQNAIYWFYYSARLISLSTFRYFADVFDALILHHYHY